MFMVSLFGLLDPAACSTPSAGLLEARRTCIRCAPRTGPDALSTALVKTAEYRYPRPNSIEEIIFYDHPSVEARVRKAMEWKAAHPEPPTP